MALDLTTLDACNPGPMTGAGNHTYLLTAGADAVLVDAGIGHLDHLAAIGRSLAAGGASLATVAVTHHIAIISGVRRSRQYIRGRRSNTCSGCRPAGITWRDLKDHEEIVYGGEALTAIHTPGHAPDHLALWRSA